MPQIGSGISAPAVSSGSVTPLITTRHYALPGSATSALIRLASVPTGRRWECSAVARGLIANVQTQAELIASSGAPAFPRTAATDSAALTVASFTSLSCPRGVPAGMGATWPIWSSGPGGTQPFGGTTLGAAQPFAAGAAVVSPDGRWAFVATAANVIHAYPVVRSTGSATSSGLTLGPAITDPVGAPTVGTIASIDVSPDGRTVIVGGGTSPYVEAWAFDPDAGAWGAKYGAVGAPPAGAAKSVRFAPSGALVAVGHATSPFVSLYAFAAGWGAKAANPAALPAAQVNSVAWAPGSDFLACAVNQASATANTRTYPIVAGAFGAALADITLTSATACTAVDWAPDGSTVAFGMTTIVVNLFPFAAGAYGARFATGGVYNGGQDRALAFTSDSLAVLFQTAATTYVPSFLLPASTWWPPVGTTQRYLGPITTPIIAAGAEAALPGLAFGLAAGEQAFYVPDVTATHAVELVLTIRDYAA